MLKATKYEISTALAIRAQQLNNGHPTENPIAQAKKELEQGILPIKIGRMVNGQEEIISLDKMQLPRLI